MTVAVDPNPQSPQHLVLEGVSWGFYQNMLDEIGDRPLRVTFHRGRIEIMSPLPKHEKVKGLLGAMIELISLKLRISYESLGSVTLKQKDLLAALEPDECYYIQHADDIEGKDRLDLNIDPPPDLAIEVDIMSRSVARQPIYAALGIPELWRFDGQKLEFLELTKRGIYQVRDRSISLPFLRSADLQPFLDMARESKASTVMVAFEEWVKTLKP